MKKIISLLLSAMLILSLTACGASGRNTTGDNDILGDERSNYPTDQAGDTLFGGDSTDGVMDRSGGSDTGVNDYDTRNPANGSAELDGTSYEHMVENGRVHDSDGNLLDNENTAW